jgi:cytochrome c-type biogenesis protein CcmH
VEAGSELLAMVEQLREVMQTRPEDPQGWRLLAMNEAGLGNLEAAWRAQDRLVGLLGEEAGAGDFADLAEMMIQAAGGYVSPEAERALREALRRDPSNGVARYYLGLMYAQGGRSDLAWPVWRRLLADSPEDAPWIEPVLLQIEEVSALAGDPTPVADLPRPRGPTMEDIEAAGDMTPEERLGMIEGMVGGLAARLADGGGPPEDWARLITAYGVLGRSDAAAAIYQEARMVFADAPGALDTLARAAERAGLAP